MRVKTQDYWWVVNVFNNFRNNFQRTVGYCIQKGKETSSRTDQKLDIKDTHNDLPLSKSLCSMCHSAVLCQITGKGGPECYGPVYYDFDGPDVTSWSTRQVGEDYTKGLRGLSVSCTKYIT